MISLVVRDVLLIAAGFGLYRMWRMVQPSQEWLRLVVAAGFLTRAILGQALFWISYLKLPVARSMQMGNGLWFFGQDALVYFPDAIQAAEKGVWAIITLNRTSPSVMFEQTLATTVLLFGNAASVGVLLNLFCYLGTMAVIVRWSAKEQRGRMAAAIAITAISLSPACVLWSLQPLKDTFFQLLVVAFVAACAAWQRGWIAPGQRLTLLLAAATMFVMLFAISGIRWYFAFALLLATSFFSLLIAFSTEGRRILAFTATLVLAVLLSRALVLAARPYLPPTLLRVLTPKETLGAVTELPASLLRGIETSRRGFDKVGGRTSIRVGGAVARYDSSSRDGEDPRSLKHDDQAKNPEIPRLDNPVSQPVNANARPVNTPSVNAQPVNTPSVNARLVNPPPVNARPLNTPPLSAPPASTPPASTPPLRPPSATIEATQSIQSRDTIVLPASHVARLVTGGAAIFLPRSVGERLGLFRIGGGRGMFWFVEIDTLVFDLMFLCAFTVLASRASASLRNPLVVFVALLTLLVAVPLVYTVTNFGTLFRLREMIFLGLALTPLALATASRSEEAAPAGSAAPTPAPEIA